MSTSVAYPSSLRAAYVARVSANLRNARVPGGDVAAWVAPLPTGVLAEILLHPRARTLELTFGALTYLRGAAPAVHAHAAIEASAQDNLARGYFAETVRLAWGTLTGAREALDLGAPEVALRILLGLTRLLPDLPVAVARRFEPRIEALYAEATLMRERHLADEVA